MSDFAAALLDDHLDGGSWRHSRLEVGPAGRGMIEGGAFGVAGVLYGGEVGGVVGVQFGAAQYRADRRSVELACEGPPRSLGLGDVGAIRQPEARQTVGRDPD